MQFGDCHISKLDKILELVVNACVPIIPIVDIEHCARAVNHIYDSSTVISNKSTEI